MIDGRERLSERLAASGAAGTEVVGLEAGGSGQSAGAREGACVGGGSGGRAAAGALSLARSRSVCARVPARVWSPPHLCTWVDVVVREDGRDLGAGAGEGG